LETFKQLTGLEIDLDELSEQASEFEEHLQHFLEQANVEYRVEEEAPQEFVEEDVQETPTISSLTQEEQANVDKLFAEAKNDRSKAYELKRELDRLHIFARYEDQFLDLFRKENT
jgi:regulator of replication initiation timing